MTEASPAQSSFPLGTRHVRNATLAFGIYVLFAIIVYWPVLAHQRFFWEDFYLWEYPVRDYNYYMLGLKHTLPFWNPYSWGWEALLSDAQCGFWYSANL